MGPVQVETQCLFQAISAQQRRGSGPITSPHLGAPSSVARAGSAQARIDREGHVF